MRQYERVGMLLLVDVVVVPDVVSVNGDVVVVVDVAVVHVVVVDVVPVAVIVVAVIVVVRLYIYIFLFLFGGYLPSDKERAFQSLRFFFVCFFFFLHFFAIFCEFRLDSF